MIWIVDAVVAILLLFALDEIRFVCSSHSLLFGGIRLDGKIWNLSKVA